MDGSWVLTSDPYFLLPPIRAYAHIMLSVLLAFARPLSLLLLRHVRLFFLNSSSIGLVRSALGWSVTIRNTTAVCHI